MNCCDEFCANNGCNQGRNCPVRITKAEMGEPYDYTLVDASLFALVIVFAASCIGYLWGGWR